LRAEFEIATIGDERGTAVASCPTGLRNAEVGVGMLVIELNRPLELREGSGGIVEV
jgi:hypothetical protein